MKKLIMLLAAVFIAAGTMQVWAGGSCCSSKKKSAASHVEQMSSLNLTDDQKAKISELEEACKAASDDKEACAKYKGQMRDVLTEEQAAKWDEMCGAKSGGGCGEKKTES